MTSDVLMSPPSVEPVSLDEMKEYARVGSVVDDELILGLIKGAREWCEQLTGRAFISQGWRCGVSVVPIKREILLKRSPLISVTQIQLYDEVGEARAWGIDNVCMDSAHVPGRIVLKETAVWPVLERAVNGMTIDYVAGYGVAAEDVPSPIRLAIKQLVLHWYENREAALVGEMTHRTPLTVEVLLQGYRVLNWSGSCA